MPTEKEMKAMNKVVAYEMRLMIKNADKESYTKEELYEFFDKFVAIKDQEP